MFNLPTNLPTTKGDKMLNMPTTIPTKLPTNKGEIISNLTNIASKLPSASKRANLVTVLPEVVKVANGVLDVFKEREKTKQSKISAKIQINESNNQKEIAIAQIIPKSIQPVFTSYSLKVHKANGVYEPAISKYIVQWSSTCITFFPFLFGFNP